MAKKTQYILPTKSLLKRLAAIAFSQVYKLNVFSGPVYKSAKIWSQQKPF